MKVFNEPLIAELMGLKLDVLSQPDITANSINFRAEAGNLILFFYWILVGGTIGGADNIQYSLGIGASERDILAKTNAVVAIGFTVDDKVPDFLTALRALNITIPKDYQVLV